MQYTSFLRVLFYISLICQSSFICTSDHQEEVYELLQAFCAGDIHRFNTLFASSDKTFFQQKLPISFAYCFEHKVYGCYDCKRVRNKDRWIIKKREFPFNAACNNWQFDQIWLCLEHDVEVTEAARQFAQNILYSFTNQCSCDETMVRGSSKELADLIVAFIQKGIISTDDIVFGYGGITSLTLIDRLCSLPLEACNDTSFVLKVLEQIVYIRTSVAFPVWHYKRNVIILKKLTQRGEHEKEYKCIDCGVDYNLYSRQLFCRIIEKAAIIPDALILDEHFLYKSILHLIYKYEDCSLLPYVLPFCENINCCLDDAMGVKVSLLQKVLRSEFTSKKIKKKFTSILCNNGALAGYKDEKNGVFVHYDENDLLALPYDTYIRNSFLYLVEKNHELYDKVRFLIKKQQYKQVLDVLEEKPHTLFKMWFNRKERTSLLFSVLENESFSYSCIKNIFLTGIDRYASDKDGNSLMHKAIDILDMRKRKQVIKFFFQKQLPLTVRNFAGLNPIHEVVIRQDKDLLSRIIQYGSDYNAYELYDALCQKTRNNRFSHIDGKRAEELSVNLESIAMTIAAARKSLYEDRPVIRNKEKKYIYNKYHLLESNTANQDKLEALYSCINR